MKKRIVTLLIAATAILSLAACGEKADAPSEPVSEAVESTVESAAENTVEPEETAEEPEETVESTVESTVEPTEEPVADTEEPEAEVPADGNLVEIGVDPDGNMVMLDVDKELKEPMIIMFMTFDADAANVCFDYTDGTGYYTDLMDYDEMLDMLVRLKDAGFTNYVIKNIAWGDDALGRLTADLTERGIEADITDL